MPKPLQILGWAVQLIGVGFIYIAFFTAIGNQYGPRFKAVWLLLAYMYIAVGRQVYRKPVTLLKPCPICGRDIKLTNWTCPYCKSDLHVSARFPGIGDD